MAITGYYNPLLTGVLGGQSYSPGALSQQAKGYQPGALSQLAYQMAGNPQMGPFADRGSPPAVPGALGAGATGPSTGIGGDVTSALSAIAKNPKLVSSISNLLGGGLGAYGSGAAADAAVTGALGSVAAQTAPLAASVEAANTAALGGTGASAIFGAPAAAPAAATAATPAASGVLGSGAGAAAAAAIPLAIIAAAAFAPDSAELTPDEIAQMESGITSATKAYGKPLDAAFTQNPNGTVNQQNYQTLSDLLTLESENPQEFAKAGGTGPITQYLQSLGYSPINWSGVLAGPSGNRTGKQL